MTTKVTMSDVELSELSLADADRRDKFTSVRTNSEENIHIDQEQNASSGEQQSQEVEPGNSGKIGAGFNFVNSIVGAGIIGLPFAVQECGLGMGTFLLFFVAYLTYASVGMIIECGVTVNQRSYESLCELCFGRAGFIIVSLFMLIFAFGAMCAYLLIVGDTIPVVIEHAFDKQIARNVVIVVFAVFIILPLCILRDLAGLAWSSSISVLADVVIVVLVLVQGGEGVAAMPEGSIDTSVTFANSALFAGLGAISFAYVCQHSSFIVFNTLKVPTTSEWRIVNVGSISSALVMSVFLALAGYLNFYNKTKPNVLKNFGCDDGLMNFARFLLALTMVFTFPMEHFVARHSLFAIANGFSPELVGPKRMSASWHFGLTALLWSASLIVGLTLDDLGLVIEITGALGASALGYILPAMCYFKIFSFRRLWNKSRNAWNKNHPEYRSSLFSRLSASADFYVPGFMIVFGAVAMVAGTISAVLGAKREPETLCVARNTSHAL